jgi:hypothetical protein
MREAACVGKSGVLGGPTLHLQIGDHVVRPSHIVVRLFSDRQRLRSGFSLLASLLFLLLVSPFLEGDGIGRLMLIVLFSLVLLAAVDVASDRRKHLVFAASLAVAWIFLSAVHFALRNILLELTSILVLIVLSVFTIGIALQRITRANRVNFDILCGAISIYLLIGITWAASYTMIEAFMPGSFTFSGADLYSGWNEALYFSLTTLTTLGYGDIAPLRPFARIWSTLEAVTGSLYIAILIATLVGMYRRLPKQDQ